MWTQSEPWGCTCRHPGLEASKMLAALFAVETYKRSCLNSACTSACYLQRLRDFGVAAGAGWVWGRAQVLPGPEGEGNRAGKKPLLAVKTGQGKQAAWLGAGTHAGCLGCCSTSQVSTTLLSISVPYHCWVCPAPVVLSNFIIVHAFVTICYHSQPYPPIGNPVSSAST